MTRDYGKICLVLIIYVLFILSAIAGPEDETPNSKAVNSTGDLSLSPLSVPSATPSPTLSSSDQLFGEDILKLRDPFRRPDIQMDRFKAKSELEQFPVDSFKLVGITTGPKKIRALVLAPNGKTFLLSEYTKIGLKGGLVRKITSEAVQVREKVVNIIGQEENVDMEIVLPTESKGGYSLKSPGSDAVVPGVQEGQNKPGGH